MNRLTLFITFMLLCMFPMNAIAFIPDGDEEDPEKVDVGQQHNGEDPTSYATTYVNAYKTNTTLTVELGNFTGNASVSVIGLNGYIVSDNNPIVGSGVVILDISSLPSGQYTLFIQANQVYQGFFTR